MKLFKGLRLKRESISRIYFGEEAVIFTLAILVLGC